jgi:hypothetical protein
LEHFIHIDSPIARRAHRHHQQENAYEPTINPANSSLPSGWSLSPFLASPECPELTMNKLTSSWLAALSGILLTLLSANAAWAERRVALIIGNSQYRNSSLVLFNPKSDAEDVAASLRALGFEVILKIDVGKRDFDLAMAQFARSATFADTALFYYAGHALQHQGQNYLMPTDAELEDEISVRYQMVSLDDVRDGLARAGGVKIMILDACRNNPMIDRLRGRTDVTRNVATVRGLARIDRAEGEVVAYATAANQVAVDGSGRNSPFTAALLKRLGEAGLEIGTMFRRIAADVNGQTKGQQRPELLISLISEYYLNQNDRPVWERIKDTADPAAFRDFIDRFPSSPRASDARYHLQILEREHQASLEVERQKQRPTPAPTIPQSLPSAPIAQEDACKRDQETLLRLRASPVRDEVIRFERELGCERLRPQVDRLRESLFAEGGRDDDREAAQRFQVKQQRPTANAELQERESAAPARVAPPQDGRVEDQGRQARPRRRAPGGQGFRRDLAHWRRPDPPGLYSSFRPFMFFDANRHDANSPVRCAASRAASRPASSFTSGIRGNFSRARQCAARHLPADTARAELPA